MSDHELALHFNDSLQAMGPHVLTLAAAIAACVPIGYLAGSALPRPAVALLVAVYSGLAIPAGGAVAFESLRLSEAASLLVSHGGSHELLILAVGLFTGLPGLLFLAGTWLFLLAAYFAGILLLTSGRRTGEANLFELGLAP